MQKERLSSPPGRAPKASRTEREGVKKETKKTNLHACSSVWLLSLLVRLGKVVGSLFHVPSSYKTIKIKYKKNSTKVKSAMLLSRSAVSQGLSIVIHLEV